MGECTALSAGRVGGMARSARATLQGVQQIIDRLHVRKPACRHDVASAIIGTLDPSTLPARPAQMGKWTQPAKGGTQHITEGMVRG